MIGHDGGTIGQYSFLRVSPAKRLSMALLTNGGDAVALYEELLDALFSARRDPHASRACRHPIHRCIIDPRAIVGRYENIASACTITQSDGGLALSVLPKAELAAAPVRDVPIAFIDRQAAVPRTGNPLFDRTVLHFSPPDAGRSRFLQLGLRQHRRTD